MFLHLFYLSVFTLYFKYCFVIFQNIYPFLPFIYNFWHILLTRRHVLVHLCNAFWFCFLQRNGKLGQKIFIMPVFDGLLNKLQQVKKFLKIRLFFINLTKQKFANTLKFENTLKICKYIKNLQICTLKICKYIKNLQICT